MALSPETKEKLQRRIDELKKRMLYDANDLDYETHLNQVRELQKIISAAGK
ncbi:MAG: aminoglycoside phosphotransferase [Anaerovibrio sp.]|nr:aminoglycoside phosphotransferase [Selenomonadaceae bacterium]MDD6398371.1 aminoglycoside phosphotransferase [Selenomonadaceae bacterium]MDY6053343.1 aminoglycoside phosphotransferase [Anaerovibrio sp.]